MKRTRFFSSSIITFSVSGSENFQLWHAYHSLWVVNCINCVVWWCVYGVKGGGREVIYVKMPIEPYMCTCIDIGFIPWYNQERNVVKKTRSPFELTKIFNQERNGVEWHETNFHTRKYQSKLVLTWLMN